MKNCAQCGKDMAGLPNPARRVTCSSACRLVWCRFTPPRAQERFWPKVDRKGPDACWPYYRLDKLGYGRFLKSGPFAYAHRTAWIVTNGPVPDGLEVAHRCDVRACCNPAHLFLATHDENMADCKAKDRAARGERNKVNKLTEAEAREVLSQRLPTGGRSHERRRLVFALVRKYGVSEGAIYSIWRGSAWEHLSRHGDHGDV